MQSIFTPKRRGYTGPRKALSFARGLRSLRPFVEIAMEGLKGRYILDIPTEELYLMRIDKSCAFGELCGLYRSGLSEHVETKLARMLCARFEREAEKECAIDAGSDLKARIGGGNIEFEMANGKGGTPREPSSGMRRMVFGIMMDGHVGSEMAQTILVRVFTPGANDKETQEQIRGLIGSDFTCCWVKDMLRALSRDQA